MPVVSPLLYLLEQPSLYTTIGMVSEKAVKRIAAAFLRLLFPHLQLTDEEFRRYCIEPAIRYRQYVRN